MSENFSQNFPLKRFNHIWLVFIVFYILVCFLSWLYAVSLSNMTKVKIKQVRAEQVRKILNAKSIRDSQPDIYNESLYNQGGGINPGFKNIVSKRVSSAEEPKERAYEQQLAEYRRVMAERERLRKEAELREAQEIARERALMEQERAEQLRQQQELQKAASISKQGSVGPSRTFTPKSTNQATAQKTQIGTLKTSKLGESTFQKQRF